MITLALYVLGVLLLATGQAIALARKTDGERPITHYVRMLLRLGPLGFFVLLCVWLWLGWHYLVDGVYL